MKHESNQDVSSRKKPYVKPEVKQVPLRPEEAVLGFCKNGDFGGPSGSPCPSVVVCSGIGS